MTREQVRASVLRAAQEAYALGLRQGTGRNPGRVPLRDAALQYAEQLVMATVDLALEQAAEEAVTLHLQLVTDPEPDALAEHG